MYMYAVGGFVRDAIMGVKSKDLDFSVVADSYDDMVDALEAQGVEFYLKTPEYYTARGKHPKWGAVDFVWARKDGPYSDGRRPDWVEPGTIDDDLARRDFTMNAMAIEEKDLEGFLRDSWFPNNPSYVYDPFGGLVDIEEGYVRAVGDPFDRFVEDALRVIRAMRFAVTKNMVIDTDVYEAMRHPRVVYEFSNISNDRVREELDRMFRHDPVKSIRMLSNAFPEYLETVITTHGVWFKPTSEAR